MIGSIRHLRASTEEWRANDKVIPDGEIALERTPSGNTVIKIGNGSDTFSALPSILGQTVRTADESIELKSGYRYVLGTRKLVYLSFPIVAEDDFNCEVSFKTRNGMTSFGIDADSIVLTGDGTADNVLIPEPYTHYTLFLWCDDGTYHGVVRGAPYAP